MKSKLKKSELRQLIKEELNNFNENENKELPDVEKIKRLLPKIDKPDEYLDLLKLVVEMGEGISTINKAMKLKIIKNSLAMQTKKDKS